MDWFKGKFTDKPESPIMSMGKSMVSGSEFPFNQSIEIDFPVFLRGAMLRSLFQAISGSESFPAL